MIGQRNVSGSFHLLIAASFRLSASSSVHAIIHDDDDYFFRRSTHSLINCTYCITGPSCFLCGVPFPALKRIRFAFVVPSGIVSHMKSPLMCQIGYVYDMIPSASLCQALAMMFYFPRRPSFVASLCHNWGMPVSAIPTRTLRREVLTVLWAGH